MDESGEMPKLRIFLSHKLSATENARQFISHLTTFSSHHIEVVASANFRRGEEWEPQIRAALDTADWLMLLFTDMDENWDWCLYETGYFSARMDARTRLDPASGKRLICLHKATIAPRNRCVHSTLHLQPMTRSIVSSVTSTKKRPWKIFPELFSPTFKDQLAATKLKLLEACNGNIIIVENYDISPTITLTLTAAQIKNWPIGTIPEEAIVDRIFPPPFSWIPLKTKALVPFERYDVVM